MTAATTVLLERHGPVGVVTLNRPDSLNAFSREQRLRFNEVVREVNADPELRIAVLTGAGRAFCAGADLAEGFGDPAVAGALTEDMLNEEYKPGLLGMVQGTKPWIAAVNGPAAGIGAAYALSCDLVVMASNAFMYQAFAAIGLVPDGGLAWHLVRTLGPKRAFEMIVSGEKVAAERCEALGLCNRVVGEGYALEEALSWAQDLAQKSPLALRYSRRTVAFAQDHDLAATIAFEAACQHICVDSEDARDALAAFFEKREPRWRGR